MRNKIYAHLIENTTVRVLLVDGPIARVESSRGSLFLPLKCNVGTFDQIIEKLEKHAVVYIGEVKELENPVEESLSIRWGFIE